MSKLIEIECPYCDGVGTLEDRKKATEYTCPDCKGKGTIYAPEKLQTSEEDTETGS